MSDEKLAEKIAQYLQDHFASRGEHLANVVVGPRREEWFNAESFVAINKHSDPFSPNSVTAYGEEAYKKVLEKSGLSALPNAANDERKEPDLVGYTGNGINYEISFIIESKVIYDGDINDGNPALVKLAQQLRIAKRICPNALVMGVVYFVKLSSNHPENHDDDLSYPLPNIEFDSPEDLEKYVTGQDAYSINPDEFLERIENRITSVLPDNEFKWVNDIRPHFLSEMRLKQTSMLYPHSTVSVGMAVRIMR